MIPPGWRARRTARTGGRTEATGSALAASQAGATPATIATATAIGTASAARPGEACRPSADDSGSAAAAPSSPAVRPIAATSPSTAVNSRGRVQPRQASTPSSRRRPRIAADAELATNSTHTTRISTNSTRLFLSIADRMATATPFFTQFSDSASGGWPNFPAGRSIVVGDGDDPGDDVHIQAGAHLDLLGHLPDPLQGHRIRPGDPRHPNPHHADRIVNRHMRAVVARVLQRRAAKTAS